MPLVLPGATEHAPVTTAQFSLLIQIVVRDGEYCYVRSPVSDDVRALVRRGYLLFGEHNGRTVVRPTAAGRKAIER